MIHTAYDLQNRHTMACPGQAEFAVEVKTRRDLLTGIAWAKDHAIAIQVLGDGSNVLAAEQVPGLTLLNRLQGVRVHAETAEHVVVDVASGVSWHWWVCFSSAQGWHGLENLALIPGTVGAAPVQNIGAYGVEVGDYIVHLDVVALATGSERQWRHAACDFGYRQSVFKGGERGQWFITGVRFRLPKRYSPILSYRPLDGLNSPSPEDLISEVVSVRRRRLPDPYRIPNAGSFFTNPIVSAVDAQRLLARWPALPVFPQPEGRAKLAAGWLIDQAGMRGVSDAITGVGAYENQALVLINPQRRTRSDVLAQAAVIQERVRSEFGVQLEREPQLFGP